MNSVLNRYQVVAACALIVFVAGAIHSVDSFLTTPGFEGLDDSAASPVTEKIAISLPGSEPFPAIGASVSRNPFAAPSRWRRQEPGELNPPPLDGLLKLTPSPVLLRSDGLPRLGKIPDENETRVDRKILTRIQRSFRSRRSSERTEQKTNTVRPQ